ncbi:MAG: GLPGLI family protein [Bacteroidota bacterium]
MKNCLLLIVLLASFLMNGQTSNYKISYLRSSNGKLIENQDPILVFTNELETTITNQKILDKKAELPFEVTIIDRKKSNHIITLGNLPSDKKVATIDSTSLAKQNFEFSNEKRSILGYTCKKAKTIINSNAIELWYTNDLPIKGSPTVLGQNLGLVLEINRNGNFIISATKIEKIKSIPFKKEVPEKYVDMLTYRDVLWKSRFTTIPIFKEQIINFSGDSKSNDTVFRYANGTIAVRKIKFPEIKLGSQIFVDLQEQSNGDAYDRTGSVFIIPTQKTTSFLDGLQKDVKALPIYTNGNGKEYQGVVVTTTYDPLIELMRFFTPFGIKQYNTIELKDKKWHEVVPYRQDISDMRSLLSNQEVWIGVNIGNYDKGGHKVSLNVTIHPEEEATKKPTTVVSLFNTNNVMEMAGQEYGTMFNHEKGLEVSFTLEKDMKNAQLRYITTGHGGWENGDEFVPKKNTILLNGREIFGLAPWRQDCGSYRLYNPASGNFPNGLSSSDYSRANWCPGMVTNPFYIDLGDLKAGSYTLQIKIPQGAPEGNSFSAWNVSGVLIGE